MYNWNYVRAMHYWATSYLGHWNLRFSEGILSGVAKEVDSNVIIKTQ